VPLRRLVFGLATLLGFAKRGFFLPYRYAGDIAAPGLRAPYAAIEALMRSRAAFFEEQLDRIERHARALEAIGKDAPPAPRWTQDWFPRLDAAVAYALVRDLAPKKIVEIGSGHSTRFMARAVADGGLTTELVAVDPVPRAAIRGLPLRFWQTTLDGAPAEIFAAIAPGDMLFVDSSHILMPGSDVDTVFNRLMPGLPAGALIHVHDIFLPEDYPAHWDWRGYNEQNALASLIQSGGYEVLFASRYVATRMAERLGRGVLARLPLVEGALETSLWLRKLVPAAPQASGPIKT